MRVGGKCSGGHGKGGWAEGGGRLGEKETDSERNEKRKGGKVKEGLNWEREKDESQEERNVYLGLANKDQTKTKRPQSGRGGAREGGKDRHANPLRSPPPPRRRFPLGKLFRFRVIMQIAKAVDPVKMSVKPRLGCVL